MKTDVRFNLNRKATEGLIHGLNNKAEGDAALTDLFDGYFMVKHTTFPDFRSMLDTSPLDGAPSENLKDGLQSAEWSEFVNANTRFPDWNTMLTAALRAEVECRLIEEKPSMGLSQ